MDALHLLLHQHAGLHSVAVANAHMSLEDVTLGGLSEAQLRARPSPGQNSIAWLLWHMTRCEDAAVNVLVAGRRQVLDAEDWLVRLNVPRRDIGAAMTEEEMSDLSERVDLGVLRGYRAAVGRCTRTDLRSLPADELREVDDGRLRDAINQGVLGSDDARWLEQLWQGRLKIWFLSWLVTGHTSLHFGEAQCVRSQAGLGLGL